MDAPRRSGKLKPRNWLDRSEQRRLFWTWMPPALVLLLVSGEVERRFLSPARRRPVTQVDTVLAAGPVTRTVEDAVTIEGTSQPQDPGGGEDADGLAAPPEALAAVRDDTVFRASDAEAWFAIWRRLAAESASSQPPPRGRDVGFAQLFEQPRSFRGRRVRFSGRIRRLQVVDSPENDAGIERTWQAWVEPAGGPPSPIVVYFLDVPDGMPLGPRVDVPVIVEGVFFKRWAYQASDAIRLAPLVMAATPVRPPRIESGRGESALVGWALVSIVAMFVVTWFAIRSASRGRRRQALPERLPDDLPGMLHHGEEGP